MRKQSSISFYVSFLFDIIHHLKQHIFSIKNRNPRAKAIFYDIYDLVKQLTRIAQALMFSTIQNEQRIILTTQRNSLTQNSLTTNIDVKTSTDITISTTDSTEPNRWIFNRTTRRWFEKNFSIASLSPNDFIHF